MLQLEAFNELLKRKPSSKAKIVLVGGCRDEGDFSRVKELEERASKYGISDRVSFRTNVPFEELQDWLGRAFVGIHTMWNEHFGIG